MDKRKMILTGILLFGLSALFFLWYGSEVKNWFNVPPYSSSVVTLIFVAIIILVRRKIYSDDQ